MAKVIVLCDDLHCHQAQLQRVLDRGWSFIFVCKPSSHETLYDYLNLAEVQTLSYRHWNGRFHERHDYRFAEQLPL
ncbi:MAG: ISNCY family transposase, partial [Deinococcota bacterium]